MLWLMANISKLLLLSQLRFEECQTQAYTQHTYEQHAWSLVRDIPIYEYVAAALNVQPRIISDFCSQKLLYVGRPTKRGQLQFICAKN